MYTSFARMTNSPLVFWFTVGMLVALPIILCVIGVRGIRKDDPNEKRAGHAMLGLAGLVAMIVVAAVVYMIVLSRSGAVATAGVLAALIC